MVSITGRQTVVPISRELLHYGQHKSTLKKKNMQMF